MRLIHLGLLYLEIPPQKIRAFTAGADDITVSIFPSLVNVEDKQALLLVAQTSVIAKLDERSQVVKFEVDNHALLETAIEKVANLISVKEGTPKIVKVPAVNIALLPQDEYDKKILEIAKYIEKSKTGSILGIKPEIKMDYPEMFKRVADRFDGVQLLAEAQSQVDEAGQFKEYVRFFERAFRLGPFDLIKPITDYFADSQYGYTEAEIENWFNVLRHPSFHADRRDEIYMAAEVRPVLWRMRQAAYDVLMNKADWRRPSTERKGDWKPEAWSISMDDSVMHTYAGASFRSQMMWLGQHSKFPMDMKAEVRELLPKEWWIPEYEPTDSGIINTPSADLSHNENLNHLPSAPFPRGE
jgi:hypothetical protein